MPLCNPVRGEISATLGGREVRLCVTLGALAALESHFGTSGFEALSERLGVLSASDLIVVLKALMLDEADLSGVGLPEAISAVVRAFEAMNG